MTPPQYATHWFMTLFSTKMPLELTLRIWDIFFIEGKKILYRVVLAIMKLNEKELLKGDFEKINNQLSLFVELWTAKKKGKKGKKGQKEEDTD